MKTKKKKIDYTKLIRLVVVFITVFIISLFYPRSEIIEREVKVGDIWTSKDLIAQFSFPVLKYPDEYEKELLEAEKSVLPIFEQNDTIPQFSLSSLEVFVDKAKIDFKLISNNPLLTDSILKFYSIQIDIQNFSKIWRQLNTEYFNSFEITARNFINYIYSTGYLNIPKDEIEKDSIFVRSKNQEKKYHKEIFFDSNDIENLILQISEQFQDLKEITFQLMKNFTGKYIFPNLIYNEGDTQLAIQQARYKVSRNIGIVLENERIVAKHQKITEEIKRKIDSYRKIRFEKGERTNYNLQFIGKFLHNASILILLGIYIYLFRKKIYNNTSKILIISIILILISFLAFVTSRIETDLPIEYLIFIPAASMLITIIFDSRLGFYVTIVTSLIIGGIRGNDYTIATANIIAGALAVYSVRDIKNRSQIFRSLIFIFSGYVVIILAFGLERYSTLEEIGNETIFALVNSIISPVLTYGLLIFFEKIFKVTTDLTLIELADFNHPLLQELRLKAPGTFHHSVNISILSEGAAKAIGANTILTKVGALYHDVGKIVEPNYFIENLRDEKSEHEDLNPEQSAQIILNHVEEGIELARKYNLPEEVIDFIPMHHGTTHVQYFLSVAKQLGKKIDEDKFRYPGPKPQSKETGIVMLADAVESISRNLEVTNENILSQLIDEIIRKRFFEGQLDETNLTLKDLTLIKQSFVETLLGIYHQRIEYPEA